jgi:hypothetical protein
MTRSDMTTRARRGPFRTAAVLLGLATLLSGAAARADIVLSIQSVSAAAGSTGNALDVTLMNTGQAATAAIGAFSFELIASTNNVTFTGVNISTSTAPYIFDGLGLFGANIGTGTGTNPPTVSASDLFSVIGSGTVVGAGAKVGLGRVLFDVPAGAPAGPITLTFDPIATSLSDTTFPVPVGIAATLGTGTITVTGTGPGVPEPSVPVLAGLTLAIGLAARYFKKGPARG